MVKGRGKISCIEEVVLFFECDGALVNSKTHQNSSLDRCKFAGRAESLLILPWQVQGMENTGTPAILPYRMGSLMQPDPSDMWRLVYGAIEMHVHMCPGRWEQMYTNRGLL